METKNIIILGALALIAILGMRSCNQNTVPTDATTSAVVKEVEKKKETPVKAKANTAPKTAAKKPAPTKAKAVATPKAVAKKVAPEAAIPEYENNKTHRFTFGADAK